MKRSTFLWSRHASKWQSFWRRKTASTSASFASTSAAASHKIIDIRSDTVTSPSRAMLESVLTAPTGDDVLGEDPTVLELEAYMADLLGMEAALFVPTGTMANLCAIMAHCHGRASEIIIGAGSHICLWEGGGAAGLASVHTRQLTEDPTTAQMDFHQLRTAIRDDSDDHFAQTAAICLENTHNLLGGRALSPSYVDAVGQLTHPKGIALHVDGARMFHAATAHQTTVAKMNASVDSVSICLSKGLGAPAGSVLVGRNAEFIRLAKRARKRCGGGMRQAGVLAAMGLYAVQNNVERLTVDHQRARRLAERLEAHGFVLPSAVETNIVYFALPSSSNDSKLTPSVFSQTLAKEWGVKLSGGYARGGGEFFRVVMHLDLSDEDVDRATEAMIHVAHSHAGQS